MERICCICASYNRPKLLGQAIAMFQVQDYPNKELVILEDSGIFGDKTIEGDRWKIISTSKRLPSVAAKRNAIISSMTDAPMIATYDDDDWYLPWRLSAAVESLKDSKWSQPRQALEWDEPGVLGRYWVFGDPVRNQFKNGNPTSSQQALDCCYGAQWSFRRDAYLEVGGHSESHGNGEDTEWGVKMFRKFGPSSDAVTKDYPPSYVYSRFMSGSWHGSEMGPGLAYHKKIGAMPKDDPAKFIIELPEGYSEWTKDKIDSLPVKPRKW